MSERSREEIKAAWLALFEALRGIKQPSKYRGREFGATSAADGYSVTPGRMAPSTRDSVERFLELKAVRDAKRLRIGVARQ